MNGDRRCPSCSSSTTTARRSTCSRPTCPGARLEVLRARDGVEALDLDPPGPPGRGRPGHPAARPRRLGGAARLKADPATAASRSWSSRSSTSGPGAWPWARPSTCSSRWAATTCSRRCAASGLLRRPGHRRRGDRHDARHRILVVEDNALNLKLVRDVLQLRGVRRHRGALRVRRASRVAAEQAPDLVLMDLQLPGIDGTEALQRLRADGLEPAVPVVAVTAFAMHEDRERAAGGRLRRLRREADQRARPRRSRCESLPATRVGRDASDALTVLAVDDQPAEPPAARRRAGAPRLPGARARVRGGGAGAARREPTSTWCCSTS